MAPDLTILIISAVSIGFVHTLLGPDHYIPFVAMAKAGGWSRRKALLVTALCGVGHVVGSVALGLLGVALGWAVGGMELVESIRGEWAGWILIAFGLVYGIWGVRRALTRRVHSHAHAHTDGSVHSHSHSHHHAHAHAHTESGQPSLTPWVLFTIFVLGPCEPLIPLLMVPAASHSWWGLLIVTLAFGVTTIITMTAVTFALIAGLSLLPFSRLERWTHALAGLALFTSGGAIQWLGL